MYICAFNITFSEWHKRVDRKYSLNNCDHYYVIVNWERSTRREKDKERATTREGKNKGKCKTFESMFSVISSWQYFF